MDHRVHTWRFEFKLGGCTANHAAPRVRGPLQPFCSCYPLFC
ncbi:hypothetical protein E2C01_014501 [Portunus trituberculatus]|uniref:Uncharacterized protein n=1 Tax=Portunus trituberculatus TaxID=210409 RepID=A0A5B7DKA2_PORTR|nr:hypothetical protein [Portunus trituberculatus]